MVPKDFSNSVGILGTWLKASKIPHTFTCRIQPHARHLLQKPHFLKFNGKSSSSGDSLDLGWGSEEEIRVLI